MLRDNKYKKVFNIESLGNNINIFLCCLGMGMGIDRFVMDKFRVY